ncbi:MAG: heme exporter protein CcmB [Gammaproteobacteria bacterium]|jgi:heme exporter protein B
MSGSIFLAVLRRDLELAFRRWGELVTPLMFFVMVSALFPLGLSPAPSLLKVIAPGVIWVGALLSGLLGLEPLFRSDYDDGALEQMALSPHPLGLISLARVSAHWLVTAVPLLVLTPLMAEMLAFPMRGLPVLLLGLLLGTPTLSMLGAVGAALTVSLGRSGMLLPILILPLVTPILIFGARAAAVAADGGDVSGPLYLLASLMVLSVTLAPLAIGAALRINLE